MSGNAHTMDIRGIFAKGTSARIDSWLPQDEAPAETAVTWMELTCWGFPSHRQPFGSLHSISKAQLWSRRLQRHCHLSLPIGMHQWML